MTTTATPDPSTLPSGQRRVLDAVIAHWREHGQSPSIRELCTALDIGSPNGVVGHLAALAKKRHIEWDRDRTARGVFLAGLRDRIRGLVG